jgi:hypothetical protein
MHKLTRKKKGLITAAVLAIVVTGFIVLLGVYEAQGASAPPSADLSLTGLSSYQLSVGGIHLAPLGNATSQSTDLATTQSDTTGTSASPFIDQAAAITAVKAQYSLPILGETLASCTLDNVPSIRNTPCWAVSVSPDTVVFHGYFSGPIPKATYNVVFVDAKTGAVLGSLAGATPSTAP